MAIPEYGFVGASTQTSGTTIPLTVPAGGYALGDAVFFSGYVPANQTGTITITDPRSNTWTIFKGGDATNLMFFACTVLTTAMVAGDVLTANTPSVARQTGVMWARPGLPNLTQDGTQSFVVPSGSAANMVAPSTPTMAVTQELVYAVFAMTAPNSTSDPGTQGAGFDLVGNVSGSFSVSNRSQLVQTKRPAETLALAPTATHAAQPYVAFTIVFANPAGVGTPGVATHVTYKVLGQIDPAATTDTLLYQVPTATQTVCSTLSVTNRGGSSTTFRVRVAVGGAAAANKQYLAYDAAIAANTMVTMTLGLTLGAADQLVCYAGAAQLSFQVFGQENS